MFKVVYLLLRLGHYFIHSLFLRRGLTIRKTPLVELKSPRGNISASGTGLNGIVSRVISHSALFFKNKIKISHSGLVSEIKQRRLSWYLF